MRVAIDVSPLASGHKVRGVGFYLQNLKDSLVKHFPKNDYLFFESPSEIPSDFKVVHFPYFEPFFLSLPSLPNKKIVVTVHDLTPIVFPSHFPAGLKGSLKWQIQKRNLKKTDSIITDSNASRKDIEKILGIAPQKVQTIYLAASSAFRPVQNQDSKPKIKEFGLPEQFFLYVGDVTWNKNLPRIVQATKDANCNLVMAGKALANEDVDLKNPWNKDLLAVRKETEGDNRFKKLGFLPTDDLNLLYNSAQALVMPSLYEGFGLPILEAMQVGCPVITSKEGSIPEVAGNAAFYVDAYNKESIKDGIIKLMENVKLREDLGRNGIERAKQFNWKKTAQQTLKVYEELDQRS